MYDYKGNEDIDIDEVIELVDGIENVDVRYARIEEYMSRLSME